MSFERMFHELHEYFDNDKLKAYTLNFNFHKRGCTIELLIIGPNGYEISEEFSSITYYLTLTKVYKKVLNK